MLCDIEAYVDNSLIRNQYGEIIGRQSGIKGWLAINCPDLHCRHSTIMRYKATAEKFRQAFDLKDPYPAAMLLDDSDGANTASEITVRNSIGSGTAGEVTNEKGISDITVRNSNDSGDAGEVAYGKERQGCQIGYGQDAAMQELAVILAVENESEITVRNDMAMGEMPKLGMRKSERWIEEKREVSTGGSRATGKVATGVAKEGWIAAAVHQGDVMA